MSALRPPVPGSGKRRLVVHGGSTSERARRAPRHEQRAPVSVLGTETTDWIRLAWSMFDCGRHCAGARAGRLAVVAAGVEDVALVGHSDYQGEIEQRMELRELLRSGAGACIASDLVWR